MPLCLQAVNIHINIHYNYYYDNITDIILKYKTLHIYLCDTPPLREVSSRHNKCIIMMYNMFSA